MPTATHLRALYLRMVLPHFRQMVTISLRPRLTNGQSPLQSPQLAKGAKTTSSLHITYAQYAHFNMLLHNQLEKYNLILASASPRRRELLAQCGLKFELADKFECDEHYPATMPCIEVAQYLSTLKSNAYPKVLGDNDILLTADTVVIARSPAPAAPWW